ncbi:MAG TPA: A/G-specific adenine glycosylase [Candidatus Acidoferrales bacterium]
MPRAARIPAAPWTLSAPRLRKFRGDLLKWFHREKRALPWRERRDSYRIWISEIMLQQTRVAAVIPYYERFMKRFPTIQVLADAQIETVLKFWAGLGYYSRARNLHQTAKQIVSQHGGEFPRAMDAALTLPGIGAYTSAAILSIAYGFPAAVLDGNVARVLARLGAVEGDLRAPDRWSMLNDVANTLLDAKNASDWNESMMELGATICTPRAPRCEACPIAKFCRARALGIQNELPAKRVKRATEQVTLAAAVLIDSKNRTVLVRHSGESDGTESAALFSRLWQFPAVVVRGDAQADITEELRGLFGATAIARKLRIQPLDIANHTVTFRRITLAPYLIRVAKLPPANDAAKKQIALSAVAKLAVSSATRKIAVLASQVVTNLHK